MFTRRALLASSFLLAALSPALAAGEVKVVASFSILADLVHEVGGDRVSVRTLVPVNGDAHVYQPTPNDSKAIAEANLVVFNGLTLEGWGDRLVSASGYKGPLLKASDGVTPRKAEGEEAKEHPGAPDPHAWQNVANVKTYVANIRDALIKVDPAGKADYEARAAAYTKQLGDLDDLIRSTYAGIPKSDRRMITTHDAFGYYAAAYGLEILAPQGTSTDSEPSAKQVAALVRQIKKEKIKAIFVENISDPRMTKRIADETKQQLGGTLYSDALSPPDGPAGTYLTMMRNNLKLISAAMKGTV